MKKAIRIALVMCLLGSSLTIDPTQNRVEASNPEVTEVDIQVLTSCLNIYDDRLRGLLTLMLLDLYPDWIPGTRWPVDFNVVISMISDTSCNYGCRAQVWNQAFLTCLQDEYWTEVSQEEMTLTCGSPEEVPWFGCEDYL